MKTHPLSHSPDRLPPALAGIPFFKTLTSDTLRKVLAGATILDAQPGEILTAEGSDDQALIFLLQGKVRIRKDGTTIAAAWESGELLGELALLKHAPRSADIVAETHVYCLRISPGFLESLTSEQQNAFYAAMYRFLAQLLADRLKATSAKLAHAEKLLARRPPSAS